MPATVYLGRRGDTFFFSLVIGRDYMGTASFAHKPDCCSRMGKEYRGKLDGAAVTIHNGYGEDPRRGWADPLPEDSVAAFRAALDGIGET